MQDWATIDDGSLVEMENRLLEAWVMYSIVPW